MCAACGWRALATRIEQRLERVEPSLHRSRILQAAVEIIVGNQHVTPDQREAIVAVLEQDAGNAR